MKSPAREVLPCVGDGLVEELADRQCRVFLGASSWAGLAATVGRFDADITEVSPPELAHAFADLCRRFAAAGGSPGPARRVAPANERIDSHAR